MTLHPSTNCAAMVDENNVIYPTTDTELMRYLWLAYLKAKTLFG